MCTLHKMSKTVFVIVFVVGMLGPCLQIVSPCSDASVLTIDESKASHTKLNCHAILGTCIHW